MPRSSHPHTDRDLLARIARSTGRKSGYKQLIRELGLGGGRERRLLLEQLGLLVARGDLTQPEDDVWANPKIGPATAGVKRDTTRSEGIEAQARSGRDRLVGGRLDLHRDGFGFVRPDAAKTGRMEDIFIPPNEINGAMQGDLVLVDEAAPGRDGRRSGKIARVLTRSNPTVVGVFHYAAAGRQRERGDRGSLVSGNFVTPLDERVATLIAIPEGAEVVPVRPESPHRTLGSEARPTLVEPRHVALHPLEGLAVDVEITDFPAPGRPARGRVIEVLGPPDAFGVDVEIVIRKHHIPHTFSAPVLAEAAQRARESVATLTPDDLREREDFRALPIVTIDGETARDFDDAVLVRPLENGNTELQVHIADVSWYVRPGSALDTEARVRGTSVYFPDRAVPMLPHALSSGMCSLLHNQDRLVLSCVMEIDPRGEIVGYRVCEGLIRSAMRMTYTSVQRCIDASPDAATWNAGKSITAEPTAEDLAERERIATENPSLPPAFDRMLDLALRLNAKRARRGSIDFDLPEPVVEFDPDGNMKAIVRSERGWSHRLIEEFMLSANECIATWLERTGIPSIYRIHEMPDPKRIVDFEETAAGFGHSLGIGNLPVRKLTLKADRRDTQRRSARGKDSRAAPTHEIPERIPVTPQMYQKLVKRISGHPEERILAYLMLRSLKQARYAEKNEGHFALASPSYTHFTSPIRRYPDLIVHRLLRAMLRSGADPRGGAIVSTDAQPWQIELDRSKGKHAVAADPETHVRKSGHGAPRFLGNPTVGRDDKSNVPPIAADELNDIAIESSQAERRAADAERELIEWKKIKFMQDRIGEDFHAIILSVTKYGFFVELNDIFIEGLVPLNSLVGDFYTFRDTDRTLCGARTGHCFAIGQKVEVLLDRIDREQRRLQFALLPGTEPKASSLRAPSKKKARVEEPRPALTTKRSGKSKTRQRNKKSKGKR
ncbi:MAG: RNB domain-containing ribonuclease [Acidobacteriota bacterium]|nr:RNB domain-containing ribonuclease [Acidobacteriota bacterium]